MSNCHSAQSDYSDHDFIGGICKDCGEVSKRDVKALADQVKILESKVTELVERNRRLANQIVGTADRMQDTIGQVVREAKVTALREAAEEVGAWGPACIPAARALVNHANTLDNQ